MPRGSRQPDDGQEIYEALSAEVRRARMASGLTQVQVAAAIGVDQQTYSDYERSRTRIPLHLIGPIEDALGLRRGDILVAIGVVSHASVPVVTTAEAAIRADPGLDAVSREVVLVVYQYCTREAAARLEADLPDGSALVEGLDRLEARLVEAQREIEARDASPEPKPNGH